MFRKNDEKNKMNFTKIDIVQNNICIEKKNYQKKDIFLYTKVNNLKTKNKENNEENFKEITQMITYPLRGKDRPNE